MTEIFRFIEQAYPEPTSPGDSIGIGADQTRLQDAVAAARNTPAAWTTVAEAAQAHIGGDTFLRDVGQLHYGAEYAHAAQQLAAAAKAGKGIDSVDSLVADVFGHSREDLAKDANLAQDRARVDDALLALKLAPDRGQISATPYQTVRRVIALIQSSTPTAPRLSAAGLNRLLYRPLLVDPALVPSPPPPAAAPPPPLPPGLADDQRTINDLIQRVADLEDTYQSLMSLHPADLDLPAAPAPAALPGPAPAPAALDLAGRAAALAGRAAAVLETPRTPPKRGAAPPATLVAKSGTVSRFSPQVQATLASLKLNPESTDLQAVVEGVRGSLVQAAHDLRPYSTPAPARVYRLGSEFFALKPLSSPLPKLPPALLANAVIKPFMIGNLQVVRQELVGYEASDISHIENVLQGESYRRCTERKEVSSVTTVDQTETTQMDERDLQSTQRDELRPDAQAAASQSAASGPGQTTTVNYGTLVENNQQQFGKEVTDKAVNSVTDRVMHQRTESEQKTFIERSAHQFQNKAGNGNIRGVYQWLNKKYKARLLNYGKRLLFDVVIPEPAAFFIDSLQTAQQGESFNLVKPEPPAKVKFSPGLFYHSTPLAPSDLNIGNYLDFAVRYAATGSVEPPPPDFQTTVAWPAQGTKNPEHRAEKISVPQGYKAISGYVQNTNFHDANGNFRQRDHGADHWRGLLLHTGFHFHYVQDERRSRRHSHHAFRRRHAGLRRRRGHRVPERYRVRQVADQDLYGDHAGLQQAARRI